MKLVQTIKELQSELDALRSEGKTIGLVPIPFPQADRDSG